MLTTPLYRPLHLALMQFEAQRWKKKHCLVGSASLGSIPQHPTLAAVYKPPKKKSSLSGQV